MVKTTLKFDSEEYVKAGNALTDIEYLFDDVQGFYSSFLFCLNEQNETQSADTSVRNIENLIYQLEIYIITGFDEKLGGAADTLGAVFGENVKSVITLISAQYTEEFTVIKESLETLRDNFQVILESGSEVTAESLSSDLNATALTDMIIAFKNVAFTSTQTATIVIGFIKITATLDTASTSIQTIQSISTEMITKANYELDISIQASRKLFTKNMMTYQSSVSDAFGEFIALSSMLFTGDQDIQDARGKVDVFVIEINGVFEEISDMFVTIFKDNLSQMAMQIQMLKDSVATSTKEVTDFLAETVATNSASFVKCFGPSSNNSVIAMQLIQTLGINSSQCISSQTNVSLQAQSLMSFIVEDVVLNVKGAADQLCGCSVKGGKKDLEKSKDCIKEVFGRKKAFASTKRVVSLFR